MYVPVAAKTDDAVTPCG